MDQKPPQQLTEILTAVGQGDPTAQERLWQVVYDEMHRLARLQLGREARRRTLQPTVLIHETYLRLMGGSDGQFANRRHFFAAAARIMRCIRIDDVRRRGRLKRGGDAPAQPLGGEPAMFDQDPAEVLAVHEALDRLEEQHPDQAEVAILRYFASMTVEETAAAMDLSPRTVNKQWRLARAWLHRELSKGDTSVRL